MERGGDDEPDRAQSSTMPRVIQAFRSKAPKEGTSWLTLSNMKTLMTPDDPYRSAARTCRTHNSTFIVCPFPVSESARAGRFLPVRSTY
jgi:hypothetical protein